MGRTILGLMGLIAVGLYVLVNHSATQNVYSCQGEITSAGISQPETVFVALNQYRWWVLWSESNGDVRLELSEGWQVYYPGLKTTNTGWFIFLGSSVRGIPDGIFSRLSNSLRIALPGNSVFDGTCTQTK